MKKVLILIILFSFTICAFAQDSVKEVKSSDSVKDKKYENLKKLVSEETEEVKVEIRKPDNSILMERRTTEYPRNSETKIVKDKLKKSNKLLY